MGARDVKVPKSAYGKQTKIDAADAELTRQGFVFFKTMTYNTYVEHAYKKSDGHTHTYRAFIIEKPDRVRVQYEK